MGTCPALDVEIEECKILLVNSKDDIFSRQFTTPASFLFLVYRNQFNKTLFGFASAGIERQDTQVGLYKNMYNFYYCTVAAYCDHFGPD